MKFLASGENLLVAGSATVTAFYMLYGIEEVGHLPVMLLQVTLNPLPLFLIDNGFYSRFPL